jgi:hypothetical protein
MTSGSWDKIVLDERERVIDQSRSSCHAFVCNVYVHKCAQFHSLGEPDSSVRAPLALHQIERNSSGRCTFEGSGRSPDFFRITYEDPCASCLHF